MTSRSQTLRSFFRNIGLLAEFSAYCAKRGWRILRYGGLPGFFRQLSSAGQDGWGILVLRLRCMAMLHIGHGAAAHRAARRWIAAAPGDPRAHEVLQRSQIMLGLFDKAGAQNSDRDFGPVPEDLVAALSRLRSDPGTGANEYALQWAWRHLSQPGADRAAWEKAARFGVAGRLLVTQVIERPGHYADLLDPVILPIDQDVAAGLRHRARGAFLVSAHIGVPAAALYAFQANDLPVKTLSLGGVSRDGKSDHLVSTADKFFLRRILRLVDHGTSIAVTPDVPYGTNMATLTLPGGPSWKVMRVIPKMIWQHHIDYLYCFPIWEGGRIYVLISGGGPAPDQDETYEQWEARWLSSYREKLLSTLRSAPENALSEGLLTQFRL